MGFTRMKLTGIQELRNKKKLKKRIKNKTSITYFCIIVRIKAAAAAIFALLGRPPRWGKSFLIAAVRVSLPSAQDEGRGPIATTKLVHVLLDTLCHDTKIVLTLKTLLQTYIQYKHTLLHTYIQYILHIYTHIHAHSMYISYHTYIQYKHIHIHI